MERRRRRPSRDRRLGHARAAQARKDPRTALQPADVAGPAPVARADVPRARARPSGLRGVGGRRRRRWAERPPAGPEAMRPGDLDVVIVTRERWAVLERTLSALRGQSVSGFRTVIV